MPLASDTSTNAPMLYRNLVVVFCMIISFFSCTILQPIESVVFERGPRSYRKKKEARRFYFIFFSGNTREEKKRVSRRGTEL